MNDISCRHDNLSPFKISNFGLSVQRADNQLAGNRLSHMQTLGYLAHAVPNMKSLEIISQHFGYSLKYHPKAIELLLGRGLILIHHLYTSDII